MYSTCVLVAMYMYMYVCEQLFQRLRSTFLVLLCFFSYYHSFYDNSDTTLCYGYVFVYALIVVCLVKCRIHINVHVRVYIYIYYVYIRS